MIKINLDVLKKEGTFDQVMRFQSSTYHTLERFEFLKRYDDDGKTCWSGISFKIFTFSKTKHLRMRRKRTKRTIWLPLSKVCFRLVTLLPSGVFSLSSSIENQKSKIYDTESRGPFKMIHSKLKKRTTYYSVTSSSTISWITSSEPVQRSID